MIYDMIIVGAGTAGLSAAIYGARAGKNVLVLEANTYGGQIVRSPEVENYPGIAHISGYEFAQNLYDQAVNLGAAVEFENVVEIRADGQESMLSRRIMNIRPVRSFLPQVQSTVRSAWMVKMTLWVREFPIVPHVTALFQRKGCGCCRRRQHGAGRRPLFIGLLPQGLFDPPQRCFPR